MILEQLIEKKDIELYLKCRIKYLEQVRTDEVLKQPLGNREFINQRFKGKIEECSKLLHIITNGKIKKGSKWYFDKVKGATKSNE
jgi:hypothetical protein